MGQAPQPRRNDFAVRKRGNPICPVSHSREVDIPARPICGKSKCLRRYRPPEWRPIAPGFLILQHRRHYHPLRCPSMNSFSSPLEVYHHCERQAVTAKLSIEMHYSRSSRLSPRAGNPTLNPTALLINGRHRRRSTAAGHLVVAGSAGTDYPPKKQLWTARRNKPRKVLAFQVPLQ